MTINSSGANPSFICRRPVVCYNGTADNMGGTFGVAQAGGTMFLVSRINDQAKSSNRIFSTASSAGSDYGSVSGIIYSGQLTTTQDLITQHNNVTTLSHTDKFGGFIVHAVDFSDSAQWSYLNGVENTDTIAAASLSLERYVICGAAQNPAAVNTALHLEHLSFFPASSEINRAQMVAHLVSKYPSP